MIEQYSNIYTTEEGLKTTQKNKHKLTQHNNTNKKLHLISIKSQSLIVNEKKSNLQPKLAKIN